MASEFGQCRLCGEQRELVKAHIIPQSFWPTDEGTPKVLSNTAGVYPARAPLGVYDPNILCEKCDSTILGPLDQHAAEALLRGAAEPLNDAPPIPKRYPDAEPRKIELFVASVAWRASVSNCRFFHRIRLGRYEEVIRQMILGAPIEQGSVEVAIAEFEHHGGTLDPHQARFDGVRFSLIYAERFIFYVKTDRRRCPSFLTECIVRPGRPVVTIPRSWKASKERQLLTNIARSNPKAFPRPR